MIILAIVLAIAALLVGIAISRNRWSDNEPGPVANIFYVNL